MNRIILKLLIKYGANCNVPDGNQVHPIALAALNKHPKCVELLLPHVNRAILRGTDIDPVLAATSSDCYNSVALLIKSGYPLETPYYWEESIEIPTPYTSPLFDREYCTALYEATQNENLPIVKLLINAGAKMTYKNLCYSPFLLVLENYLHIDILLEFLKNDVDINAISDDNNFDVPDALLVSLSTYKLDRLHILLSCGLDPMLKNWCGCKYGNQSLLENVMQSPDVANIKKLLKLLLHYSPSIPACCNEIANIIGKNLSKVPTLRHLCRLAIRKSFPTSQLLHGQILKNLLIPQSLKNYLNYCHSFSSRSLSLTFKSLSM
ncbi:unnamed protein product [Acanthocheilonema viteae]|uniref:SOCS box domain-containing protein n=1 Tax=Acanthocheilonema viteae TaxID=6277 RepID=A0A498SW28_ACAVI|nr:unnamed protein product [Acanthocheilonema viteae]